VLVDASFRHRTDRDAFSRELGAAAQLLFVECLAPAEVLARRARRRDRTPARASDASAEVVASERLVWDPLEEVPAFAHLPLRTDRPARDQIADVVALLDSRLALLA
jgi:hypothetical protein